MKIKQLEASLEKQAEDEYAACKIQQNADELENQKFLTEYVACMVGIELPADEEVGPDVSNFE